MTALEETGLLDEPYEPSFDNLTALAAQALHAKVSLISIVDLERDRQFFKSHHGLGEPWRSKRETPLSHSFCKHVVDADKPLVVSYATEHPLVASNPAISDLGVMSYLGMPVYTADRNPVGAFCVIEDEPRTWEHDDIAIMERLAKCATDAIELRVKHSNASNSRLKHPLEAQMIDKNLLKQAYEALRIELGVDN